MKRWIASALVSIGMAAGQTFLIKSTDGGRTWRDIDPGPPHMELLNFQVSADGSTLFALTVTRTEAKPFDSLRDFSVLTSSDGGQNWSVLDSLGVRRGFAAIAAAPSDRRVVYLVRHGPFPDAGALSFVRTADGGSTTVAATSLAEIFQPLDKYLTWCLSEPASFIVHPLEPTALFAVFNCVGDSVDPFYAFLQSRDGGLTWRRDTTLGWLNYELKDSTTPGLAGITQLFAHSSQPLWAYAKSVGSNGKLRIVKSTDGGASWSEPLLNEVLSAALDPGNAAVLLASKTDGTLWQSGDGAESWDRLGTWLPLDSLVMHPAQPLLVLAQTGTLAHQGLGTGELMRSTDGGFTWSATPTGLDGFSFVFDPYDPDIIYGTAKHRLQARLQAPFVRNLAGGSALSPGSLFSVFGDDLAGEVAFNGEPAQLSFVSRRQVNGRVPLTLKPGAVAVEVLVNRAGQASIDRQTLVLQDSAPVILPDSPPLHADGLRPITPEDPAQPGERIVVHATGVANALYLHAQIWPTDRPTDVQTPLYVRPTQDRPGVYEIGLELPRSLGEGSYLVLFWGGRNFARVPVR